MRKREPIENRLLRYIDRSAGPDACWPWMGTADRYGYGKIQIDQKPHNAHRVMWQVTNGPIAQGLEVCHKCDNPPCCNPAHLCVGTHAQNMRDMCERGRVKYVVRRGSANGFSKLTEEKVYSMRLLRQTDGLTYKELGNMFGVSAGAAWFAVNKRNWKHV